MTRRVLTAVLSEVVDEEYLDAAIKIDAHLREQWDRYASPEFKVVLKTFDEKGSGYEGELPDFTVFMLITQAMMEEAKGYPSIMKLAEERRDK